MKTRGIGGALARRTWEQQAYRFVRGESRSRSTVLFCHLSAARWPETGLSRRCDVKKVLQTRLWIVARVPDLTQCICGPLRLTHRDDAQSVAVRQRDHLGLVEQDRPAGLDRQDAGPGLVQVFDRRDADRRHVEPHVLLGLGDLDQRPAAGPAELAGAFDAAVGSLDGLDGQRGLFLDGDRLARRRAGPSPWPGSSRTRCPSARPAVGARRVRIPSFTSSSGQKSRAEANVIPSRSNSAMTLEQETVVAIVGAIAAVPPLRSSGSRGRAGRIRQGVYITFLVTLPAMTIRSTPWRRKARIIPPSLAMPTTWNDSQSARSSSGASYLIPTQATRRPCRRAASAKRIGNRPLPASRPIGSVWPARPSAPPFCVAERNRAHAEVSQRYERVDQPVQSPSGSVLRSDCWAGRSCSRTPRCSVAVANAGFRRLIDRRRQSRRSGRPAREAGDASRAAGRSSGRSAAARGPGSPASPARAGRRAMLRCTPAWAPTITPVADLRVVLDPGLAGHDHVIAGLAAPGDADLAAEQVVAADLVVVADHHQVVDLRPLADPRGLERGAVDRAVRADLDVVADLEPAGMRDLHVAAVDYGGSRSRRRPARCRRGPRPGRPGSRSDRARRWDESMQSRPSLQPSPMTAPGWSVVPSPITASSPT